MKPDARIYWYIEQLTKLSRNPKLKVIGYDKDGFLGIVDLLFGPILDEKGNSLFPEDSRYLAYAVRQLGQISNIEQYLQTRNVPQEAIEGAKNLAEAEPEEKEILAQAKTKVANFIQEQERISSQANIGKLAQVEKNITQEIERIIKERAPQLAKNQPEAAEKLVREFKEEVLTNCFESPRQALDTESYQTIIDQALPRVDLIITEENIPLSPGEKEALEQGLKEIVKTTLPEASTLTQIDFKLPKAVQEKTPVQGTAFSPLAAAFHPTDLVRKLSSPSIKAAQMVVAGEISDEESIKQQLEKELRSPRKDVQKIARLANMLRETKEFKLTNRELTYSAYGLTSQDFQKSIDFLQKELGAGHPLVRFLEIQKRRQEGFESKFPSVPDKIRSIFALNQQLGQRPAIIELRGSYTSLPSPEPVGGMSQTFNKIGAVSHLYRVTTQFPGIRQIESLPFQGIVNFRGFLYQKTLHPFFHRLAQTSFGQAIKTGITTAFKETTKKAIGEGIKKGITWLATKFGASAILSALGTAAGPIGTAIGFAVGFLIDKAKGLLSSLLRLIKKPEFALALGLGGAFFVFGIPGVIGLALGLPLLALSGAGFAAGAGGLLGGFAAGVGAFFVALAAPFAAPIGLLVGGILGGLAIITFFIVMLTASAFIIPAKPLERISEYFEVIKSADKEKIENNELPVIINYTVTVNAKQAITITSAYDERGITCQSGSNPQFEKRIDLPLKPKGANSWEAKYSLDIDDSFKDCRLCNTATVIANIKGRDTGIMNYNTLCIDIGKPPEDCPSGWPTDHGYITQGPKGNYSHDDPNLQEAIDIGVVVGTPVKATHSGKVEGTGGSGLNKWVKVKGSCGGQNFTTLYLHLETIDPEIQEDKPVSMGQPIGTSGASGPNKTQQHLHYEFMGIEMVWPNIGYSTDERIDNILEGCCGNTPPCSSICSSHNVTW